jgi:molybdate transport system substrate-binding protein
MLKRFTLALLLIAAFLAACGPAATLTPVPAAIRPTETAVPPTATPEPRTLTVFAASSLTEAFTEIGQAFEASHPGVTVALNFAGSGALRTQLEQGAVADVFASANKTEMESLVSGNLVAAGSARIFLNNSLLVILPAGNPAGIQTLQDLARPGLKLVLGDTTVPAGKYARQVLANLDADPAFAPDFSARVLANLVSNETNVRQVVAKVQLGEADAGMVYVSDAVAAPDLLTIEIPAAVNVIAQYPIAVLTNAPQPGLAAEFIAAVISAEGQATLERWGFVPVAP